MVEDALLAEMRALQEKVAGITGTAVASRDGLIVREDTGGVDPDNLAALAATWLALAQRMSTEVGQGALREATTKSSGGSVTIYAIARPGGPGHHRRRGPGHHQTAPGVTAGPGRDQDADRRRPPHANAR